MIIKDRNLHKLLIGGIVILAATTVYFWLFYTRLDPYENIFLSKIGRFDIEHSFQEKAGKFVPGAIKTPILIYHSVKPHKADEDSLQKYYDVSPESFIKQMKLPAGKILLKTKLARKSIYSLILTVITRIKL